MNKYIKQLIISIVVLLVIAIIGVGSIVYATGFGAELTNIYDEVSSAIPESQYTVVSKKEVNADAAHSLAKVKEALHAGTSDADKLMNGRDAEDAFEDALSKFSNVYCGQHKKGITRAGVPTFKPSCGGSTQNANDYINFDGNTATKKKEMDKVGHYSTSKTFNGHTHKASYKTASNFTVVVTDSGKSLKGLNSEEINNSGANYSANVIPYTAAYSDKKDDETYYKNDAQRSIWGNVGDQCVGCSRHEHPLTSYPLFLAGKALDEYQTKQEGNSNYDDISIKAETDSGAVLLDTKETYRIGPFYMGDYEYAYSEYVKPYSGHGLKDNAVDTATDGSGLIGGICDGEIKLVNDKGDVITGKSLKINGNTIKVVYEDYYRQATDTGKVQTEKTDYLQPIPKDKAIYPYPKSTFYIDISRDAIKDYEKDGITLDSMTFKYRKTEASGKGNVLMIKAVQTVWTRKSKDSTGNVVKHDRGYCGDHGSLQVKGHHLCNDACKDTDGDGETDHSDNKCTNENYCSTGHENCIYANFSPAYTYAKSQPMIHVEKALVRVLEGEKSKSLKIRITTDISIKKYVKEIKHETNDYITFGNTSSTSVRNTKQAPSARKAMSDEDKQKNPTFAEYGDIITFQIDIKNNQKKAVKVKIKDILPDKVAVYERLDNTNKKDGKPVNWENNAWIKVAGNSETSLYIILRTEANDGKTYCNTVKIITRNNSIIKNTDDNVDFIRTNDENAPVVNIAELYDNDNNKNIESREYYTINNYNITIDKYISGYNQEMMTKNNGDKPEDKNEYSITKESYRLENRYEKNDVKGAIVSETDKNNYPVPVEKDETLIYTLRLTNYSENYSDSTNNAEKNKVATEVRPTKVIDELNKGLEFVKDDKDKYVITGKIYGNGEVGDIDLVRDTDFTIEQSGNTITITLKDQNSKGDYLVIQPGGYLLYTIKVKVVESNMNLDKLENTGKISVLTNINNNKDRTGQKIECSTCNGTGTVFEKCSTCGGDGIVESKKITIICPTCKGTQNKVKCIHCDGNGNTVNPSKKDKKVYECNKCHRIYEAKSDGTPPDKCDHSGKVDCGSTNFRVVCTLSHYVGNVDLGTEYCLINHTNKKYVCNNDNSNIKEPHETITKYYDPYYPYEANPTLCKEQLTCDEKYAPNLKYTYTYDFKCSAGHVNTETHDHPLTSDQLEHGCYTSGCTPDAEKEEIFLYECSAGHVTTSTTDTTSIICGECTSTADKKVAYGWGSSFKTKRQIFDWLPTSVPCGKSGCSKTAYKSFSDLNLTDGIAEYICEKGHYTTSTISGISITSNVHVYRYTCKEHSSDSEHIEYVTSKDVISESQKTCKKCSDDGIKRKATGTLVKTRTDCQISGCNWYIEKNDLTGIKYTCECTVHRFDCDSSLTLEGIYCAKGSEPLDHIQDFSINGTCENEHAKFICNDCGEEYSTRPTYCTKKVIKECGSTSFTAISVPKPGSTGTVVLREDDPPGIWADFYKKCTHCHGRGYYYTNGCIDCSKGKKEVTINVYCKTCGGSGHTHTAKCTKCNGTKKVDDSYVNASGKLERIVRTADGKINRNNTIVKETRAKRDTDKDGDDEVSKDYVRMKDLVIAGYVWLDMNRDGIMNEDDGNFITDQTKAYYNIGNNTKNAGKQSVVVNLYSVVKDNEGKSITTLVRTTQTDDRGRYTFSNYYAPKKDDPTKKELQWYNDYKASCWEDYNSKNIAVVGSENKRPYERYCNDNTEQTSQRIDKATNKDKYGNYTASSEFIKYYVEFEYDGIVYKSTEFYSGMDNLINDNSSADYGKMEGLTPKYKTDSNAAEFTNVREGFNEKYEYISYDIAYNKDKHEETNSRLDFDKTNHTSQLMENPNRIVTSRSFINAKTIKGTKQYGKDQQDPCNNSLDNTFTLWLFNHDADYEKPSNRKNYKTPDTEYLKYINLGLELREDVDITLTKDVYSVKTRINGEEMEYFFNQNNAFNGETGTISTAEAGKVVYLNDFIIKTPYGLDLYESDYKMRIDQYSSEAVRKYKGLEKNPDNPDEIIGKSELNAEVTYRITVANKAINDDESIKGTNTTDTKLKVKISEILDLYDTNFVKYNSDADVKHVKTKDENGYLVDSTIKVAEAWYFKPDTNGDYVIGDGVYSSNYADSTTGNLNKKPVFVKADSTEIGNSATKYKKIYLTLSNTSSLGDGNSNKENNNNFTNDGYYTLYISGMENDTDLELSEGENFDIYVKYVLDKADSETTVTNEDYKDTINDKVITGDGKTIYVQGEESGSKATLKRTLRILDKIQQANKEKYNGIGKNTGVDDLDTARGLEGIAQVNLYSVWYENDDPSKPDKPASLVDMDGNAGNLGNIDSKIYDKPLQDVLKAETDTAIRLGILEKYKKDVKPTEKASADQWEPYYEDMTYKTGIEITADGSEWTKEQTRILHGRIDIQDDKMIRELTGRVWDDSRTEPGEPDDDKAYGNDVQYMANGVYEKIDWDDDIDVKDKQKDNRALMNENVPKNYGNEEAIEGKKVTKPEDINESQDIKVRSAKSELVEIVEIPQDDGTSRYYEEVLGSVTWKQAQHIRTDSNGNYKLTGFIPGKYTVRFSYGDTVDTNENKLTKEETRYLLTDEEKENIATAEAKAETETEAKAKAEAEAAAKKLINDYVENYSTEVQKDMQVFNGQDYKTTKYAYDLESDYKTGDVSVEGGTQVAKIPESVKTIKNETDSTTRNATIDEYAAGKLSESGEVNNNDIVMLALERPDLSDARDDEIRRLEVNNYSEVMINSKAEVLKGLANDPTSGLTTRELKYEDDKTTNPLSVNYYQNYQDYGNSLVKSLEKLTDSTNMNAETVEFLVKPEKLTYQQTNDNTYYLGLNAQKMDPDTKKIISLITGKEIESKDLKDYYYNNLDTIVHEVITERTYKIENIDMGIEYRPETNISLTKEISNIMVETSDGNQIVNLVLETYYEGEGDLRRPLHRVNMKDSIGADKVQFISNKYDVDNLLKGIADIYEEKQQGFIYIAVDEDILQGCKVTAQYKFIAQNDSEIDTVSKNLNNIRFYDNDATEEYATKYIDIATDDSREEYDNDDYGNKKNPNGTPIGKISMNNVIDRHGNPTGQVQYTANNFARAIVKDDVYKSDGDSIYRNRAKTMIKDSVNNTKADDITDGYYGNFVGYTYYIGKDYGTNEKENLDTVAEMKFDRVIDYVDTDLEYVQPLQEDTATLLVKNPLEEEKAELSASAGIMQNVSGFGDVVTSEQEQLVIDPKAITNQSWTNIPVKDTFDKIEEVIKDISTPEAIQKVKELLSVVNEIGEYVYMFGSPWSDIDKITQEDVNKVIKMLQDNSDYLSNAIAKTVSDADGIQYRSLVITVPDKLFDTNEDGIDTSKNKEFSKFLKPRVAKEEDSKAIVYLPTSKVLATKTDTENMVYENIAEVIQFTTLTGRRTNYDTTIGNADIHTVLDQCLASSFNYDKFGNIEFVTAALEKDTSATETITLTPPTGLMRNRRAIFEAIDTTKDILKITIIAVAVVVIAIGVTKFTMLKIKKRRYK